MNNDTPISDSTEDKLGFGQMARQLADVFLRNDLSDGLVVGIEGHWGSGKSSLANLALNMLRKEQDGPNVILFSPWIIGDRSELIRELFLEFDRVLFDSFPKSHRQNARNLLHRYAQTASALAALGDVAAAAGIPLVERIAQALKLTGSEASKIAAPPLSALNGLNRPGFTGE